MEHIFCIVSPHTAVNEVFFVANRVAGMFARKDFVSNEACRTVSITIKIDAAGIEKAKPMMRWLNAPTLTWTS